MNYLELLRLAAPETILVLTALAVLFVDLTLLRQRPLPLRMNAALGLSSCGALLAIGWVAAVPENAHLLNGMLVIDPLTRLVKVVILVLAIFTAMISAGSRFTEHVGEYFVLLLLATTGLLFLVSSENLLMIFVSLELTSLSLYVMTAFNKQNIRSAEAALKYFLFGGMAAAFTLFGMSLLYGMSGEINLSGIASRLQRQELEPVFWVALVMTVIGFGFKIAVVPFHLWAPDAYQGAPTPSAAFIASGSKVASFFILTKVMLLGFAGAEGSGAWRDLVPGWLPVLAVLALVSMILGNLAALAQSSVKRLLAYSAIAHAGYMLLGVLASGGSGHSAAGMASLIYYAATYALTTIGAFGVVLVVEQRQGSEQLSSFAGLSRQAPVISVCMMIFMLSLAGIPPLAGFFGKFYLFAAAASSSANLGLLWLVIAGLAASVVSLYYYLQVLKQIYVADAPAVTQPVAIAAPVQGAIVLLAAGVVVLGVFPQLFVGRLLTAIHAAGF